WLAAIAGDGWDLLLFHDDWCFPLSAAAGRLAARRLDTATGQEHYDLAAQCASQGRTQDAAILVDLVGAVFKRLGRHRRHRHGVADVAGNLWRQADRPSGARL